MELNKLNFLNDTITNYNNENNTSVILFFTGIGVFFTYSIINFILGNPNKILEDIKKKEINEYKTKYYDEFELLENKKYSNEELRKLTEKILKYDTPYGLLYMFYNIDNETFNYYCNDKNIPYIILDAIARKFAITYNCKYICINFREEWEKAKKLAYEKENQKLTEVSDSKKDTTKKKSVFAEYKNYQNDNDNDNKKNFLLNKNRKSSIKRRRFKINVEQTNRFTHKGSLDDYKNLENSKKNNKKEKNFSFKDYKNM